MRRSCSLPIRTPGRLGAVLVCALLAVASQTTIAQSHPSGGYAVQGTITDAISNQPLGRALVELNQQYAQLTDASGQFTFDNVPPGSYMVGIRKPGYQGIGASIGAARSGAGFRVRAVPSLSIQVGPGLVPLVIHLFPLGVIAGHVTLPTSDPADDIQVSAYTRRLENGHYHWTMAGTARTRSDGSFRIDELSAGKYMLYTTPSLEATRLTDNPGPFRGYPPLYYPGVTDPAAAGIVSLKAGQLVDAEITLIREEFFLVTALVRSPGADEPASYQILDSGGRPTRFPAIYDRRDDLVRARVPNGSWSLAAHGFGREMLWGRTDFRVSGAAVSFAISMLPVPHIPLNIRRDFIASAGGLQPSMNGPGVNVFLVSADDFSTSPYGGGLNSIEGSNGQQWELRVQEPGRYWVQAQAFPPGYISSITSGGVDLAANPLVIVPGSNPAPIDITLRNDGGTITGEIDGLTANTAPGTGSAMQRPRVWIYAIPLFPMPGNIPTGFVRSDGQFTISNLGSGSYRVVACDTPQEIDFHSADALSNWTGKGQTVTVEAGGSAHVELSVISTGSSQ